jgi:hypothetical protein
VYARRLRTRLADMVAAVNVQNRLQHLRYPTSLRKMAPLFLHLQMKFK